MELASFLPLLLAFSLAYLLGVLVGRRRLSPPRTQPVRPPQALSPAQQCEWMTQWFQDNGPRTLRPLAHSHAQRHGRHAA